MSYFPQKIAATLMVFAATTASAATTVLTFEGVGDLASVSNFYNGAGGAALNLGISFSADGIGLIDQDAPPPFGSGQFANEPSASTVLTFRTEIGGFLLNHAAGFTDGFSTYYVSTDNATLRAWSGLDGTGTMLAEIHLEDQKVTGPGDPLPINGTVFGVWDPVGATFVGTAHSVTFFGGFNVAAFDNVTLGSDVPGLVQSMVTSPVPEPASQALMGLGLLALGCFVRGRRLSSPDSR